MDIFYSRVKLEELQDIVAFTGYYGMDSFHNLMNQHVIKEGWMQINSNWQPTQKVSSPYHSNAYSYGYKFTEWKMPMGGTFKLVHCPLYDDREINREIDPFTGYPLASQRFTFLDWGVKEGKSNFRIVSKKDGFKSWYVAGGVSPYGPMKGTIGSNSREGYTLIYSKELGVHVEDPTCCGELIPSRN
jgi:hypothetical protein